MINLSDHKTLRERIVEAMRKAIISGEFAPGEKVAETTLVDKFGISRTPIREAIRQLETEGFLKVLPRKGAVVAEINVEDVVEFYEVKAHLEGLAARLAVKNMTDEQIEQMDELNDAMRTLHKGGKFEEMTEPHNRFHDVFVNACGNNRLIRLLHQITGESLRYRIALALTTDMTEFITQHQEIIDALRTRNADAAEIAARRNAERGGEILASRLTA